MRRLLFAAAALCAACSPWRPEVELAACEPITPALPGDFVWGIADLHAHPGIERAFNGSLVWGSALDDGIPVNAAELPRIAPCPVETHTQPGAGPIDRQIGNKVFPSIAEVGGFAHAPVGTLGLRSTRAWPDARDVVHQQMNLSSIRRAYEGGLRLMFASTTDDQAIAALLKGPNFINGFVPRRDADAESARRQLELIIEMVKKTSAWMEIARTPAQARDIIGRGKLALVLSLEMNGLDRAQMSQLRSEYGVQHVFPIHLIDNAFGGTAADSPLFNSASAAVSSLYRDDGYEMQFMDLEPTTDHPARLGRPKTLATLDPPVYVDLVDTAYETYRRLCYEDLTACASTAVTPSRFTRTGQRNARGLCRSKAQCDSGARPGRDDISLLMDDGWLIDVSHMGARSVAETTAIRDYPLIASHTDVAHLCRGAPGPCTDSSRAPLTERHISGEEARKLVARHGVIGMGLGLGNYDARAVLAARGAPLLTFEPGGSTSGCVAQPADGGAATPGCEGVPDPDAFDPAAPLARLQLETRGGALANAFGAVPVVRVELRDAVDAGSFQRRVIVAPFECSAQGCTATVETGPREGLRELPPSLCTALKDAPDTGESYTLDDLEQVTVQWLFVDPGCGSGACKDEKKLLASQCAATWGDPRAPAWAIDAIAMTAFSADAGTVSPVLALTPRPSRPLVTLDGFGGSYLLFQRADRPRAGLDVRASGRLLKVSLTAGAATPALVGASPQSVGSHVCIALRTRAGGACTGTPPPPPDALECPAGWVSVNQRGAWNPGAVLYTFVRTGDARAVCGVDVAMVDWEPTSPPFSLDGLEVDAIEDPVEHWVRRYSEISRYVADGGMGVLALGTDFNGLNGTLDISEDAVPAGATLPQACTLTKNPDPGASPAQVAPMRFRNADGTLGEEVRIDERGLATYGLLQDFVAVVGAKKGCGPDVRNSLMLSAEATLRAWEKVLDAGTTWKDPLPVGRFDCDAP